MKRALILTAILAGLAGLAFLVARPRVPDPASEPYVGVRGASRAKAAGIDIHFSRAGSEGPVDPATVLHAGDSLRFVGWAPDRLEAVFPDLRPTDSYGLEAKFLCERAARRVVRIKIHIGEQFVAGIYLQGRTRSREPMLVHSARGR